MPGQNILGECVAGATIDVIKTISKITLDLSLIGSGSNNGTDVCVPPPLGETGNISINYMVSGSATQVVLNRVPFSDPVTIRTFKLQGTQDCCDNPCANYFLEDNADPTGLAQGFVTGNCNCSDTCTPFPKCSPTSHSSSFVLNWPIGLDNNFTITFRIDPTNNKNCQFQISIRGSYGMASQPCVSVNPMPTIMNVLSPWIDMTAFIGSHVFHQTDSIATTDFTGTQTWTLTMTIS
jgi:hypothetical protein